MGSFGASSSTPNSLDVPFLVQVFLLQPVALSILTVLYEKIGAAEDADRLAEEITPMVIKSERFSGLFEGFFRGTLTSL